VERDSARTKYFSPEEAVQYGIIDKVLYPEELKIQVRNFLYI
jgi:ATP-dependent protease ClpP protease subunit